jgi:hypothetical protein
MSVLQLQYCRTRMRNVCSMFCSRFHIECAKLSLMGEAGFCWVCEGFVQIVFSHDPEKSAFGRFRSAEAFVLQD